MIDKRDNPSVPDEHLPTDRYYTDDGRQQKPLEHVGERAPDTDPDVSEADPARSTSPPAGSDRAEAEADRAASRPPK